MNYSQKINNFRLFIISIIITLLILPCFPSLVNGKDEKKLTKIMGENSACTAEQMYTYLIKNNKPNTKNTITKKYALSFVKTTIKEAKKEGVRPDIAFCVMMHETGCLNYGGDVTKEQNNFAGLGTTGGGVKGAKFKTMTIGIRAVVQHLKCYSSKEPLKGKCVDPRWNDSLRGKAMYVEYLGYADNPYKKGWAYPGKGYGKKILTHLNKIKKIGTKVKEESKDNSKDNDEKIVLKREKKDQVVNTTLSVGFNVLLIYLMLLILHKINKSEQKAKNNKNRRK